MNKNKLQIILFLLNLAFLMASVWSFHYLMKLKESYIELKHVTKPPCLAKYTPEEEEIRNNPATNQYIYSKITPFFDLLKVFNERLPTFIICNWIMLIASSLALIIQLIILKRKIPNKTDSQDGVPQPEI